MTTRKRDSSTAKKKHVSAFLCFIFFLGGLVFFVFALSCAEHGSHAFYPKATTVKAIFKTLETEIAPWLETVEMERSWPGFSQIGQDRIRMAIDVSGSTVGGAFDRVHLSVERENVLAEGAFRFILAKSEDDADWRFASAWNTQLDGSRRLLDVNVGPNTDRLRNELDPAVKAAFEEMKAGFGSYFESSRGEARWKDDVADAELNQEFDLEKAEESSAYFQHLAREDKLPHVSRNERKDTMWAVAHPLAFENQSTFPRYAEFVVALKDESAEYYYVAQQARQGGDWKLTSVLRLDRDGTAKMLPVADK